MRLKKIGKFYHIQYTDEDGNQKSVTTMATNIEVAKACFKLQEPVLSAKETAWKAKRIASSVKGGVTITAAIEEYQKWMVDIGRAPKTIENVTSVLERWMGGTSGSHMMKVAEVEAGIITDFVNAKSSTKFSTRTTLLAAFRSFFAYCVARGYCATDPSELVRVTRMGLTLEQKEGRNRKPFTDEEFKALMEYAGTIRHSRLSSSWWWQFAIQTGRDTGLRISDIASLEWDAVKAGRLVVWTKKRGTRVDVEITPAMVKLMGAIPAWDSKYMFPRQADMIKSPTRRALLSVQFSRICKAVGIEDKSFHCLRKLAADDTFSDEEDRLNETMRTLVLKRTGEKLGHKRTATTEGYIST